MTFPETGRTDKQNVLCFFNELAVGKALEFFFLQGWIEVPIEVLERSLFTKPGEFGSSFNETLLSHGQFILEYDFEELGVREVMALSLLDSQVKSCEHSR